MNHTCAAVRQMVNESPIVILTESRRTDPPQWVPSHEMEINILLFKSMLLVNQLPGMTLLLTSLFVYLESSKTVFISIDKKTCITILII